MPHGLVGKKIKYRYENGWEYHARILQLREAGPDAPREIFFETGTIYAVEQIDGPHSG